jgi:hypothetical protein
MTSPAYIFSPNNYSNRKVELRDSTLQMKNPIARHTGQIVNDQSKSAPFLMVQE